MIEGRVARLLNEREVVINRGSDHGVEEGMYFYVPDPSGDKIIDPETGDDLGSLDRPLIEFVVVEVLPSMSVGRTEDEEGTGFYGGGNIARLFRQGGPRTLKSDDVPFKPITPAQSIVKVGDRVIQSAYALEVEGS